jgi:hypothetical protein
LREDGNPVKKPKIKKISSKKVSIDLPEEVFVMPIQAVPSRTEEARPTPQASPTRSLKEVIFPRLSNAGSVSLRRSKSESSYLISKKVEPLPVASTTNRLIVETVRKSDAFQFRFRMDLDSIPERIEKRFIDRNRPFPKPTTHRHFLCNSIAWKLAYLNREHLDGNIELLQRTVDVYMEKYEAQEYAPRAGKRMIASFFGNDEQPFHTQ